MKSKSEPKLSIFDTFKTKTEELTGEATRQRSIIVWQLRVILLTELELQFLSKLPKKMVSSGRISIQEFFVIWMKF